MLIELKVSHFATIDNIHIEFKPGFNILSGETGAGKSILMKSLSLLMGAKASSDLVRNEDEAATVEGSFDIQKRPDLLQKLQELGIETDDGLLIVRRMISTQGKSRVYINGSLSPLTSLQELVAPLIESADLNAPLIELTGQHENKSLLSKSYHLNTLDQYAGTTAQRKKFSDLFNRWNEISTEIQTIEANEKTRVQRLDFLCYQRDEIKGFQIRDGEEEELEREYLKIKNAHQLSQWAQSTETALYGDDDSALVRTHKIIQRGAELASFDPKIEAYVETLRQAKTLIEDSVYNIRSYSESLDGDGSSLETLEKRRSDLKTLLKKYGPTVEDVLNSFDNMEKEIRTLETSSETLQNLKQEQSKISEELTKLSKDLHKKRATASKLLVQEVNDQLNDLDMKGVNFEILCESLTEWNSTGTTDLEFMIKSAGQDKARSLAKSASGGELSRILLALKSVIGQAELPRTCLFDEVDTGVSGQTAEKVGRKLKSIAKGQQVICVTHLPQVAAHGDVHFLIQKSKAGKSYQTTVMGLKKEERVKEIARLISGEKITQTSLAHAQQLLRH
ncbi:MAG: DNA repair protein RecN [Bdellovibrionales bacterium]